MIRWMTVTMVFCLIYFHWNVHIFSLALTFNEGLALFLDVRLLQQVGWLTSGTYVGTDGSNLSDPKSWRMTDDQQSCQEFSLLFLLGAWQWLVHQRVSQVPSTIVAFDQFCLFFCLLRWLDVYSIESICGQLHSVDHVFSSWPGLEAKQANGLATQSCEHCCCSKVLNNILYVNLEWGNIGFSRSQSMATLDELDSEHRWRSIYACSTRAVTLMPMLRSVLLKKLRR